MKIALVNPPLSHRYVHIIDEPLGILYLAASVRDGHQVHIVDSFGNMLSVEETVDILEQLDTEILGISLTFTGAYKTALEIAEKAKGRNPSLVTVLGGNTATFLADALAQHPFVDYVVRGEGDLSFPGLIKELASGNKGESVPGVSFSRRKTVVHNPAAPLLKDLDVLPFPARELLPLNSSYPRSILSSRGCAYGCIYCSSAAFWGRSFRMRSIDNIIDEIKSLNEGKDLEYFSFADDCLTLVPARAAELASRIGKLRFDCVWGCTGRIETLSEELIRQLAGAGCKAMFFGVESGSERVLRKLGRRYTPQDVCEVYKSCIRHGIKPYFSFIVGLPFEEEADLFLTYRLIQKLEGVENGVHILTPLPGTPIFNEADKYGLKITSYEIEDLDINSRSLLATASFTSEYIDDAYRKAVGYSFKALRSARTINSILKQVT